MTLFTQTPGETILDHYADVIEGGSAYNGGSSYKGVAGSDSVDELIGTTFTADSNSADASGVIANDLDDDIAARLVRTDGPPMFLHCDAGTSANVGAARKITSFTAATNTYGVQVAFPTTPQSGDTFSLREGFKRAPDFWDINDEAEGVAGGFDRFFSLSILPGPQIDMEGSGNTWFSARLELRLRLLKHKRARLISQSLETNLARLRAVMIRPDQRDGTYVQSLQTRGESPEIEIDDTTKLVAMVPFELQYKIVSTFV